MFICRQRLLPAPSLCRSFRRFSMAILFDCWKQNTKCGKRYTVKTDHRLLLTACCLLLTAFFPTTAPAQIKTDIIEKYRAELQKQGADAEMKRERGTQPQDWLFKLPEGVVTRQITFYSDGTPCYGRIFFPKGFNARGKWPAVVVGHGINAQAVGIEKYTARFAERGLV